MPDLLDGTDQQVNLLAMAKLSTLGVSKKTMEIIPILLIVGFFFSFLILAGMLKVILTYLFNLPISFTDTVAYQLIGTFIGIALSVSILYCLSPDDIIFGTPDYYEKRAYQSKNLTFCLGFTLLLNLVFLFKSVYKQIKGKT